MIWSVRIPFEMTQQEADEAFNALFWGFASQEPPARPADSASLGKNPTHLPTRGDHGPDQEPAISPERR